MCENGEAAAVHGYSQALLHSTTLAPDTSRQLLHVFIICASLSYLFQERRGKQNVFDVFYNEEAIIYKFSRNHQQGSSLA